MRNARTTFDVFMRWGKVERTAAVGQLRVVAIDDHQLMLDGIRLTLEVAEGIEVVGEALSATEAIPLIERTCPDVVLLDVRMPQIDGFACLAQIRERFPEVKVVMLSGDDEREQIRSALDQGAAAFIVKHVDPRDLASALRQVADGTVFQVLGSSGDDDSAAKTAGITESELRVLRALAQGKANKVIARDLFVTEQTVKFHLTNIYRKLNVSNRTEATRFAYQHGLADNPFFEVA